jgi:hypothetical protein
MSRRTPETGEEGAELHEYVARKTARMHAGAIYRRLKSTVDAWQHEERAKTRVAVQSLVWFLLVMSAAIVFGSLAGIGALGTLSIGFIVWFAIVLAVMAEQLARKPGEMAKPRRLADRALLGLAISADALGVLTTWPLFALQPSPWSVARGVVLLALFGALLALLTWPRLFGARPIPAATALCAAVPLAALAGALGAGAVALLQVYTVIVAAVIGWLNWVVIRRQAAHLAS